MDSANVQGTLPTAFGALTKLTTIDFTTNELTGTLPSELSLLTDMHTLRLGTNKFVGTVSQSNAIDRNARGAAKVAKTLKIILKSLFQLHGGAREILVLLM